MIVPRRADCMPYRIFISVDLPAPFSPQIAWIVAVFDGEVDVVVGDDARKASS